MTKKKKQKSLDPRTGLEFKKGRMKEGTSDHLRNPVVARSAEKGRMFTAAEVRALDEAKEKKNYKKKDRIKSSGDKDRIKLMSYNLTGYTEGGMCRGAGAAIKGTKFKGVF